MNQNNNNTLHINNIKPFKVSNTSAFKPYSLKNKFKTHAFLIKRDCKLLVYYYYLYGKPNFSDYTLLKKMDPSYFKINNLSF
jgi:hypothetical protein